MMDYTPVLSQIAEAVKTIASAPNWWMHPSAVLLSGVIGGVIGYVASQRTILRQEKRQREVDDQKKALVFSLLRDEITLRWKGEIYPYLLGIREKDPMGGLCEFATMELRGDDVFIFKRVSESFPDYSFLGDQGLVSRIIHGYLLVIDLADFKKTVELFMSKHDKEYEGMRNRLPLEQANKEFFDTYSETILSLWTQFRQKIEATNERFRSILDELGNVSGK